MAAVWCSSRKPARMRRRAVLYSSSVGGVQWQRGVPGMLPVLQPGRCGRSPALEGPYTSSWALDVRPLRNRLRQTAYRTTPLFHSACRRKETTFSSAAVGRKLMWQVPTPTFPPFRPIQNRPYPSTATLLCLSLFHSPAWTCHPLLLWEFVQLNQTAVWHNLKNDMLPFRVRHYRCKWKFERLVWDVMCCFSNSLFCGLITLTKPFTILDFSTFLLELKQWVN